MRGRPSTLAGHIEIGAGIITCVRCKNEHKYALPMNARKFITIVNSYMELHRDCPDPKQTLLHGVPTG